MNFDYKLGQVKYVLQKNIKQSFSKSKTSITDYQY